MYGLFWDCPDGSSRPNTTIESVLCQRLLQSGLVESCKPTNMTAITATPPSPPKIRSALLEVQTVSIVITLPHFLSLMSLFFSILILSLPLSLSVTTWIIQVDSLGQSLTAGETLRSLEEVLEELAKSDILA